MFTLLLQTSDLTLRLPWMSVDFPFLTYYIINCHLSFRPYYNIWFWTIMHRIYATYLSRLLDGSVGENNWGTLKLGLLNDFVKWHLVMLWCMMSNPNNVLNNGDVNIELFDAIVVRTCYHFRFSLIITSISGSVRWPEIRIRFKWCCIMVGWYVCTRDFHSTRGLYNSTLPYVNINKKRSVWLVQNTPLVPKIP